MAAYLYDQALTIPGVDRKLHMLAAILANGQLSLDAAKNKAYEIVPPTYTVPNQEAYADVLEKRLLDEAVGMADLDRIETYNIRFRSDPNPELVSRLRVDLTNVPDLVTLKNLLAGRDASGDQIHGKVYRKNSVSAIDIVWSPSKDISVAYSLAKPGERASILDVHRRAVDAAMHRVAEITGSCRSNGGIREPGHVFWVAFDHWQSRTGDPLLHTHTTLLNVVLARSSGRITGLDTFRLPHKSRELLEAYNVPLTDGLREIGIDAWYDKEDRVARIRGIPGDVTKELSRRGELVKKAASEYAEANGADFTAISKSAQRKFERVAVVASRKTDAAHGSEVEWRTRAQAKGWTIPELFATMPTGRYHRQHEEMDWDDDLKPNRNMPNL